MTDEEEVKEILSQIDGLTFPFKHKSTVKERIELPDYIIEGREDTAEGLVIRGSRTPAKKQVERVE